MPAGPSSRAAAATKRSAGSSSDRRWRGTRPESPQSSSTDSAIRVGLRPARCPSIPLCCVPAGARAETLSGSPAGTPLRSREDRRTPMRPLAVGPSPGRLERSVECSHRLLDLVWARKVTPRARLASWLELGRLRCGSEQPVEDAPQELSQGCPLFGAELGQDLVFEGFPRLFGALNGHTSRRGELHQVAPAVVRVAPPH